MSTDDLSQIFYKITNEEENHHGFQYRDGLNILKKPFNSDPNLSCCSGGFYFTNIKNIFQFVEYGCNVREITLPLSDPGFKIVKDPQGDKWRANKIILGKKYDLWIIETLKMLVEKGADIHITGDYVLQLASQCGYLEIVKYLIEKGVDIHADNDFALRWASTNGQFETVKYLVEKGANVHADDNSALESAVEKGYIEIVKYLVENEANIHVCDALEMASFNGHLEIVKYLVEKGADIHAHNDFALQMAYHNGHLEMISFLKSNHKNLIKIH
jgi:hypothetical protein